MTPAIPPEFLSMGNTLALAMARIPVPAVPPVLLALNASVAAVTRALRDEMRPVSAPVPQARAQAVIRLEADAAPGASQLDLLVERIAVAVARRLRERGHRDVRRGTRSLQARDRLLYPAIADLLRRGEVASETAAARQVAPQAAESELRRIQRGFRKWNATDQGRIGTDNDGSSVEIRGRSGRHHPT
jgi:hypothetical protein